MIIVSTWPTQNTLSTSITGVIIGTWYSISWATICWRTRNEGYFIMFSNPPKIGWCFQFSSCTFPSHRTSFTFFVLYCTILWLKCSPTKRVRPCLTRYTINCQWFFFYYWITHRTLNLSTTWLQSTSFFFRFSISKYFGVLSLTQPPFKLKWFFFRD